MTSRTVAQLGGLLVPAATTFTAAGDLDGAAFQRNLSAHLALGMDGVLVAGSSGESALLDDADRRQLLAWARETVPTDKWLLAGVGSESTRQTISRAHDARAAGADAVLVVSPHYYLKRMTPAALRAHFEAVADASPLPVLLYNIPAYAHVVLDPETVHALARHENVIGMKDSAGNLPVLAQYLEAQGPSFRVLTGSGGTMVKAIEMGASGAILAIALFVGALVRAMMDHARDGRLDEALAIQQRMLPLATDIAAPMGPAGIKAAMDLMGLDGGPTRAPLQPLSPEEQAIVEARLSAAGAR